MVLFDRNLGLKYQIERMNSLAVKLYQFYAELFKSCQQKLNIKYQF